MTGKLAGWRNGAGRSGIAVGLCAALVGLVLWVGSAGFGGGERVSALTNCDVPSGVGLDAVEAEFLVLINEYRVANGRSPLTIDSRLNRAAQWLSNDMLAHGYLDHTDRLGRDALVRMGQCGHPANVWFSEIVLKGASNAAGALSLWKGSPGHNAAMLDPAVHSLGIGKAGSYWTVDFSALAGDGIGGEVGSPVTPTVEVPTVAPATATATVVPPTEVPPTVEPTAEVWRSVAPGLARDE